MPMNPMSPKATLPPAPAFRLLSDLNEFFAHPLEERQAAYDAYMTAAEQRQASLDEIAAALEASKVDRAEAAKHLLWASGKAKAIATDAQVKAKQIVDAATEQAESVNGTARENVAAAAATVEAAEDQVRTLGADLAEALEAALERETAAAARETTAEERIAEAEASKAAYDGLIADFNALQRRAPK